MGYGALIVAVAAVGCGRVGFEAGQLDATGISDVATDRSAVGNCPAFALFCDDFESGDLSKWTTVEITGSGQADVVGTRVHGGALALEARKPPSIDTGGASPRRTIVPQSSGILAVRSWINLATPLTNFNLVTELRSSSGDFTTAGGDDMQRWASSEARSGTSGTIDHIATVAVPPADTWTCVELLFDFDSSRVQLFVQDAMILDEPAVMPRPTYDLVGVGAVRGDEVGLQVFQDDVVIADRRIGCQ